jgi:hypothetical protein
MRARAIPIFYMAAPVTNIQRVINAYIILTINANI